MKKVGIVAAIHGDEVYGIDLHNAFIKAHPELQKYIQLFIGNVRAHEKNKRFIDSDLNRIYNTGLENHETTELSRLEAQLEEFKPDYIIDIHTTRRSSGVFILSDQLNDTRKTICAALGVPDVCIMRDGVVKNSFIGNHSNALSVEYSLDSITESTSMKFVTAAANLIKHVNGVFRKQNLYEVVGLITREEWDTYPDLKNKSQKPEGIALMVPRDKSEMDAEYYGFWCRSIRTVHLL
ncbi:MAG: succinylglutamate desuccinylase/aspartoacylase family protein [Candidatus Saccharibacteria bacterium]|nr:succinylglutamate desuccinylase/aspartoacylase family protein [Candidatus Saccharibacteria bacterium]